MARKRKSAEPATPVETLVAPAAEAPPAEVAPPVPIPLGELVALPEAAYNDDREAVRKGWLDRLEPPARLPAYLAGLESEPPPCLTIGRVLHAMVLEPDLVRDRYYRAPPGNRSLKRVKVAVAEAAELNPGKEAIRAEDWDLAIKMRDSVWSSRAARAVLQVDAPREHSMFWDSAETGLRCKARYDIGAIGYVSPFLADVKTAFDASPAAFEKAIVNNRLDVQGVHYTEPLRGVRFVFVVIEKKAPYPVAVYAAGDEVLAYGKRRRDPNMRTYRRCLDTGIWPGYPDVIQRIGLPRWAR